MERPTFPASSEALAESERVVAWLRLPAIALIALGQGLAHPDPHETGFLITLTLFSAWSAAVLAWVHVREVTERFALLTTVKTHVQHLYEKLGVSDRAAAVASAMRRGLIE